MRAGGTVLAAVVLAGAAPAAAAPEESGKMGAAIEYPHAGITVALPRTLTVQSARGPFEVVRAARREGGRTVLALSLSAFPVDAKAQADAFADAMLGELRRTKGVKKFKVRGKGSLKIAGTDAAARRISYFLGDRDKIAAVRAAFVRQIDKPAVRICYVLSIEAPATRAAEIQSVLAAVADGIELIDVARLSAETMVASRRTLKYAEHGFQIVPPRGWYVVPAAGRNRSIDEWRGKVLALEMPVQMGLTDYLAGGRAGAAAWVVVGTVPPGMPASVLAVRGARAAGQWPAGGRAVSDTAATIAELPARQQVVKVPRRSVVGPKKRPATFIVTRALCVWPRAKGARGRGYALVLRCSASDGKAAAAVMDKLAAGLSLPGAATRPTSRPASRPATAPATAPASPAGTREDPEKTLLRHGAE